MRVLIAASGTVGDVHPLVAIGSALAARGHQVILLANQAYSKLAKEAGIEFESVGDEAELAQIKKHPKIWNYSDGWKLWIRGAGIGPMRRLYDAIKRLHQPGKTVVVSSYLCFGARIAREKLAIPTATVHLNVHTIRTVFEVHAYPPPSFCPDWIPKSYVTSEWYPVWYRRMNLWLADKAFIDPVMKKEIVEFRRSLDLPELKTFVRDWWNSPDCILALYPDWWAGEHPDWPKQVATTGFPFWDRGESLSLDSELETFLEQSKKLIVCTPGASAGHNEPQFRAFESACAELNQNGLIITPRPPAFRSERVRFASYVPFKKLLPYASAVVHHAGIGTSAYCLAAGVPQLVIPTLYNQPDTAIRLERLGVARQISPKRVNAKILARSLSELLDSPAVAKRCASYAEKINQSKPMPKICDLVERLLNENSTS